MQQAVKICEEAYEVIDAMVNGKKDDVIHECWDVICAVEGLLRKFDEEDVSDGRNACITKGNDRDDWCDTKQVKKKPTRHKYGTYKNVLLSDDDFAKLSKEFPYDLEKRINNLSEYMESTGKKYKSHIATIRSWAKRDNNKNKQHTPVFDDNQEWDF